MKILFFLFLNFILYNNAVQITNITNNNNSLNLTQSIYYETLFDSIDYDYYNLTIIYNLSNKSYNSIKIKHKSKINLHKKEVCIIGFFQNMMFIVFIKNFLVFYMNIQH